MKITLIGSTKPLGSENSIKNAAEAIEFGRDDARICYSEKDYEDIVKESPESKSKLITDTMKRGHHSVYDHANLTFYFDGLPKIGAMLLNNEKVYATSEKSARYTKMKTEGLQKELYDKWMPILQSKITETYPDLDSKMAGKTEKLAQENARYMTSVFTPTKMAYTVSFRQLNYLMHFFDDFIENAQNTDFNKRVKEFMAEFNYQLKPTWYAEVADKDGNKHTLNPALKRRSLSLFTDRTSFSEEFGENYSTSYKASFACLAQLHRHRTLNYEIQPIGNPNELKFFVPPILQNEKLEKAWLSDLEKVAEEYPQATLLDIHETGNYKDFISKANERLCGNAQLEIKDRTRKTLQKYINRTHDSNPWISSLLSQFSNGPKCSFPDAKCTEPCPFGPKLGIERLV